MHLLAVPFSKSIHVPFLARLDQPLHLRLEIAAVGFPVVANMPTFDVIPSLAKWNPVLLHMLRQRWEFLFDPLQEIEASFLEALVATKLSSEATHFRIKESRGLEAWTCSRSFRFSSISSALIFCSSSFAASADALASSLFFVRSRKLCIVLPISAFRSARLSENLFTHAPTSAEFNLRLRSCLSASALEYSNCRRTGSLMLSI